VTAYVRTRPLDEVLLMVKERQGAASNRLRQQEDWKGAAKKRAEVKSEADMRCSAFTDVVVNLQVEEGAGASGGGGGGGGSAAGLGPGSSGGQQEAAAAANGSGGASKPKVVVSASSGEWSEAQELALVQGLKQFGKELEDRCQGFRFCRWAGRVSRVASLSTTLQDAYAFMRHPHNRGNLFSLPNGRWERIAAAVEGKTKKQCMARYKELREAFKSKKTEA
jgi:DnaJ family protein C protein 2